jgi:hypothetical protein
LLTFTLSDSLKSTAKYFLRQIKGSVKKQDISARCRSFGQYGILAISNFYLNTIVSNSGQKGGSEWIKVQK